SETNIFFKRLQDLLFEKFIKGNKERENAFKKENLINISSPGRVNIIGEHTDYNLGLSINAAINKYIFIAGYENKTDYVEVFSRYLNDSNKFSLEDITFDKTTSWINYIKGVLKEYIQHGHKIGGFSIVVDSNLPIGAGISSSASLEVGVAEFVEGLFNLKIDKIDTVKLCNSAENNFVGVNCGFMDQFSVAYGKENNVIYLNFKDLSYEYIPFDLEDNLILIVDSKEERNLANTEYNKRRQECNDAVQLISKIVKNKNIKSLSDIGLDSLDELEDKISEKLFRRVKHVVTENNRVLLSKEYLLKGDIEKLGQVLFESHNSLRYDYEVSTEKLNYIVDEMSKIKEVYGGRLMGAGFGGSVISIIKKSKIDSITDIIGGKFLKKFSVSPDFIECLFSDGTRRVKF
ncbi:MAG: galactokinase, partial [Actinobacteria bacterium]|nr:galactokinase [Actinomycetota bacterium]